MLIGTRQDLPSGKAKSRDSRERERRDPEALTLFVRFGFADWLTKIEHAVGTRWRLVMLIGMRQDLPSGKAKSRDSSERERRDPEAPALSVRFGFAD